MRRSFQKKTVALVLSVLARGLKVCRSVDEPVRGGEPTPFDRILATRFGHRAAQLVLQRKFGRMVTLRGARLASVPIADVANIQRLVSPAHELVKMARDIGVCLGD